MSCIVHVFVYVFVRQVDWLDRLTFREIEMINEQHKRDSNFMYLMIEFPHIHIDGTECSVVYFEMVKFSLVSSGLYKEMSNCDEMFFCILISLFFSFYGVEISTLKQC